MGVQHSKSALQNETVDKYPSAAKYYVIFEKNSRV